MDKNKARHAYDVCKERVDLVTGFGPRTVVGMGKVTNDGSERQGFNEVNVFREIRLAFGPRPGVLLAQEPTKIWTAIQANSHRDRCIRLLEQAGSAQLL